MTLRAEVVAAFREAIAEVSPAELVARSLPKRPPKGARVRVVALGKAAVAMIEGAYAAWPDRIEDALAATTAASPGSTRALVLRGAHPVPDASSERAAEETLRRARELGERDLLLSLVSGGASAVAALPCDGVTLADKQRIVARLLDAGAPIRDVNTVRRHLSRFKGGRLALAASPARTLTLVLSDVIGGLAHDVGSGPTVPDPTTVADAAAVLARFAPELSGVPLSESLEPGTRGVRTRATILADPATLADRAAAALRRAGFSASTHPPDEGDVGEVVARRVAAAEALRSGEAIAIACEPVLSLPAQRGAGGRAGYVALAVLHRLPRGVVFLAGASDGVDGSSGTAGAAVTAEDADRVTAGEVASALAAFDDARVHRALGTALEGGATGTNLADLHILARR